MSTQEEKIICFKKVDGVGILLKKVGTNFVLSISGTKEYYIEFDGLSESLKHVIVH